MPAVLYFLTFLSGFAALVYEMLWTRQLSLVLGNTTAAISTVVAAYMGGLALGSALFGRRADSWRRHLASYALIELGIGVTSLAVLLIIPVLESIYPAISAGTLGNATLLGAVRFVLVFLLLLVPTCLMGGTYPVLVKAITRHLSELGRTTGRLYATNTLGAVVGCLAAGVYLLGALGIQGTGYLAVGMNLAIALVAFSFDRWRSTSATPDSAPATTRRSASRDSLPARSLSTTVRRVIAVAIAATGFAALGYEIIWSRILGLVIGHSIYAFTFVLSTYLAGLALGGFLAALVLDRLREPIEWFVRGLLALAVCAGATLYMTPVLPFYDYNVGMQPLTYVAINLLACGAMLLLPTILLGAMLPLSMKIYTADLGHAGTQIGAVYAYNTIGSIAGSLATGFLFIPWIGTQAAFLAIVLGNLVLALLVGIVASKRFGYLPPGAALLILTCYALVAGHGSPLVRDKSLARAEGATRSSLTPLFFAEDQVAAVALCSDVKGTPWMVANGEPMTSLCIETTWMAHLPLAVAKAPREMLVLCLGAGNTVLSALPYDVNVTAVEISPMVVEATRRLHGDNLRLGANDRIVVADARNTVLVDRKKFDVITVDPPPPLYSAGCVNFHTAEFYEACRDRLSPGGALCLWLPFGHCTEEEYKMLLRTFYEVFPRMAVWSVSATSTSGLYLMAWGDDVQYDSDAVRSALLTPIVAADVARFDDHALEEILPRELLRDEQVALFCGAARVMTDNRPWLEFPLFRNAGSMEPPMSASPINDFLARPLAADP